MVVANLLIFDMVLILTRSDKKDIGSQASQALRQLVENSNNTITGFRNLLGGKYVFSYSNVCPTSCSDYPK
jgi:hypothetical protein